MNLYFFYSSHAPAWERCKRIIIGSKPKKKEHLWAKIKKRFEKALAKDDDTAL